ncbi:AAA family ATPase, partial [Nanoarchaeota archaeon]
KKSKTTKVKGVQRFVRVQGSPDLTVEDLLGDIDPIKALKYGPSSIEAFTPGKIFKANNGILFFDEVNRCPEKIQNSLLQVLEEGKATIGSYTIDIPANFIFIGTMNPEEVAATEKLSDVFLDRFDVIHMSYPDSLEIETDIVNMHGEKLEIQFPHKLLSAMIMFVRQLREHKDIQKKPSVRVSLGLFERAQANAFLNKHKKVDAKDIQDAVISVLSHRIELKPSVKYLKTPEEFISEEFSKFQKDVQELSSGDLL